VGLQVRALVTGSAGFIGRHVTRTLVKSDYDVTGIDVADGRDARDFFRQDCTHYDVIVHAAAVVGGRKVIDGDPLAQAVNLELDAAMFAWARRTSPGRVVYLSSSSAYPVWLQSSGYHRQLNENDIDLSNPDQPDALYGWCKLTGERLARIAAGNGVRVSVVRPFSGYGEDQDDCYPFPAFAARARRRENPFTIWGSSAQVRDWIHIDDICAAIMVMIREGIDDSVNLGSGTGTSMIDLARYMTEAAGYEPEFMVLQKEAMGVMHRVANVEKMLRFCAPRVTLLDGITRAIKMGD
jgi:nucleoside-diphosphate-sugar epimerase